MMTQGGQRSSFARRLAGTIRRFGLGRRGAVAPIMALALIPILMAMGMAAEASNWWLTQRNLQHAADSAALAAAIDAGANGGSNPYVLPTASPSPTDCSGAWGATTSWYCQAKATSRNQGYQDGVDTVTVTPTAASCTVGANGVSTVCYKVKVTKNVPIYLLTLMGFAGNSTYNGAKAEIINATAVAAAPGPPLDFCILTTNGDFTTHGTPSADIKKCSIFANGGANCTGQGVDAYAAYASGNASCNNAINASSQSAQCDPYGLTTQTIQGNSVSCPNATNASGNVPPMPGCTSPNTAVGTSGSFPNANVITQASLNGTAASGSPNAVAMTVGGVSMQVIQVCGNAAVGSGISGAGSTGSVTACPTVVDPFSGASTPEINFNGTNSQTSNLLVIVYSGSLDFRGCTLRNMEPTTTAGGMTVILAPPSATLNSACPSTCTLVDTNNSPGTLNIAAPKSGEFSGIAVMESANYAFTGGCGGGNSGTGGATDWCNAGNSPTLDLQGLVYTPNASIHFAGAISKFQATGALNCTAWIVHDFKVDGSGWSLNNYGTANLTGQCSTSGVTLPGVPGTHAFYQALVA